MGRAGNIYLELQPLLLQTRVFRNIQHEQSTCTYTPLEDVSSKVPKIEREVRVIDPGEKHLFLLKSGKSLFIKWDSFSAINTMKTAEVSVRCLKDFYLIYATRG